MDYFRTNSLNGFCMGKLESERVRLHSPIVDPEGPIKGSIIFENGLSQRITFTSLLPTQQDNKRITIITSTQWLNTRPITYHFLKDRFHRMDVAYQIINHVIDYLTNKFWEKLEVINREPMAPQEPLVVKLWMEIVREVEDIVEDEAPSFVSRYAVESFERVDIEEDEEVISIICICEMDSRTVDARTMPCSHRCHGECILT
ncbi:hypothetical protein AMTR_s00002p00267720 [Amborella trichopoda]|uniref:Uncharacterized protein n=1 Tax=Amborella trichopoda TaxID=13333 RepID=W1NUZ4_AMBTC|nr:hypothetical protein AMTR_s00002p00267720 [Amborella trichopoda]